MNIHQAEREEAALPDGWISEEKAALLKLEKYLSSVAHSFSPNRTFKYSLLASSTRITSI